MNLNRSLLFFLLLCATTVQAQLIPRDEIVQPDDEALQLPPYPSDANLIAFDPGFVSAFSYYIDTTSLKVGKEDRIVRYTLVIKSDSGATNVSYEGLRCADGERKVWAFGDGKKGWMKARDPQWKAIEKKDAYRQTLYDYFFCPRIIGIVNSEREAVDALKAGSHRDAPFGRSSDLY